MLFLLQVVDVVSFGQIEFSLDFVTLNVAACGLLFQDGYRSPDLSKLSEVVSNAFDSSDPEAYLRKHLLFLQAAADACHVRVLFMLV